MSEKKAEQPDQFEYETVRSDEVEGGKDNLVHGERQAYLIWDSFERLAVGGADTKADAESAIERLLSKSVADEDGDGEWRYAVVEVPVRTSSHEFEYEEEDEK